MLIKDKVRVLSGDLSYGTKDKTSRQFLFQKRQSFGVKDQPFGRSFTGKIGKGFSSTNFRISAVDLARIAEEHSPIDLAYAVAHLPPNARPVLYDSLPTREAKVKFLTTTDSSSRLTIFRYMSDMEMKKLFENMPLDEAVKVSDDLSERRFKRLLELLDMKRASRIRDLKKHHRNSAGRLMTSEFFAFSMDMTIGEASATIRDNPRIDFTRGIYVLNEQKELQGYVPGRNLIINPSDLLLGQVMRPILHKVTVETSREEVVDLENDIKSLRSLLWMTRIV